MTRLILLSFAAWRLSNLLVNEAGPGNVLVTLRRRMGVKYDAQSRRTSDSWTGDLFNCIWCMSVWAAGLVALLSLNRGAEKFILTPLGLAGLVVAIEEVINHD